MPEYPGNKVIAFHFNEWEWGRSLMREERLEVPVSALREALINALCHRQWEKDNLTISIAVYDDRVEIANPGILPPKITPENIK